MGCRENRSDGGDPGVRSCLWQACRETFRVTVESRGFRCTGLRDSSLKMSGNLCPVTGTTLALQSWRSRPSTSGHRWQIGQNREHPERHWPPCPALATAAPAVQDPVVVLWLVPQLCPPRGACHWHLPGSGARLRRRSKAKLSWSRRNTGRRGVERCPAGRSGMGAAGV